MLTLPDVVREVRELSASAASIAVAIDSLIKAERDPARRGGLHRLATILRELSLHTDLALARLSEVAKQSSQHRLSEVADELKTVLADAPAGPNRAVLDSVISEVGAVRRKVAATT